MKKAVRDLIQAEQAAEAKVEYEVKRRPNLTPAEIKAKVAELETEDAESRRRAGVRTAAELRDEMREWERADGNRFQGIVLNLRNSAHLDAQLQL